MFRIGERSENLLDYGRINGGSDRGSSVANSVQKEPGLVKAFRLGENRIDSELKNV